MKSLDNIKKFADGDTSSWGKIVAEAIRNGGAKYVFSELRKYEERIFANSNKGVDVRVGFEDLADVLDVERGYALTRNVETPKFKFEGRRVYTGQTEQPGPNPGYYKF
jgi:hypothetical protein